MARPERFELPTAWFVARYSIQLSYGRMVNRRGIIQKNLWPSWPHRQDLRFISSGPAGGGGTHRNGWSMNKPRHPRMSCMPGARTQGPCSFTDKLSSLLPVSHCIDGILVSHAGDHDRGCPGKSSVPITPAIRRQDQRPECGPGASCSSSSGPSYQPDVPGSPLNGPTISSVIQPP